MACCFLSLLFPVGLFFHKKKKKKKSQFSNFRPRIECIICPFGFVNVILCFFYNFYELSLVRLGFLKYFGVVLFQILKIFRVRVHKLREALAELNIFQLENGDQLLKVGVIKLLIVLLIGLSKSHPRMFQLFK